jgi:bidirectional [NiFe] hydrogenase diaphorase subunit
MALVKTTINGTEIEVERDSWALDVIREQGLEIPTLCKHAALEPYGACRMCVVEVTKGKWTWITTACDLPIRDGLSIKTETDEVTKARKMALELMWTEAPESEVIQAMAREMGIEKPQFENRKMKGKCILCGLCVGVCDKLVGASAIGFANRGKSRQVGTPMQEPSEDCIGCMACVAVCPTGHIRCEDDGPVRNIKTFRTKLELASCDKCKKPYVPVKQLDYIKKKMPKKMAVEKICDKCRRSETVAKMIKTTKQSF